MVNKKLLNKCPKCRKNSFNVFAIFSDHYLRKCKECSYPQYGDNNIQATFYLPKLKKRIIYLDEFAIIELNKVRLNTQNEPYWHDLYIILKYLVEAQLIICPYSEFHIEESMPGNSFSDLERTYQLLSHGVNFKSRITLLKFQFNQNISKWLKENSVKAADPNFIFNGHVHGWNSNMSEHIDTPETYLLNDEYFNGKTILHEKLGKIFERWKDETSIPIESCFEEEWRSFGPTIINWYYENKNSLSMINQTFISEIITTIIYYLRETRIDDDKIEDHAVGYLNSDLLGELPFNRLRAALFACLAQSAKGGQKQIDESDIPTDIQFISYYLPYCDAILIDKKCHHLLNIIKNKHLFDYNTKVFSMSNSDSFIDYLKEIKNSISDPFLLKLKEVYGDTWQGSLFSE
jgi:hypothetical protein